MYSILIKALLIIIAFILSAFFPEKFSLAGYGKNIEVTLVHITAFLAAFIVAADILQRGYRTICSWFTPSPERRLKEGLSGIQACFESLILKDAQGAQHHLDHARRFLDKEIPLLLWLEGRVACLEGQMYRAQSLFYALNARTEGQFLGSYEIYRLAQEEKDNGKALVALESALERYGNSEILLQEAFLLALREKHFSQARTFITPLLQKDHCPRFLHQWEALSYFLEAQEAPSEKAKKLLRTGAEKAPDLPALVVSAVNAMSPWEQRIRGRSLLKRAWESAPHPLLEEAFRALCATKKPKERQDLLHGLFEENPESWLSSYGLGKLAYEAGIWGIALQHFTDAYTRFPARLCAEKAAELVKLLHPEGGDHSSEYYDWQGKIQTGSAWPVWTCAHCAHSSEAWVAFCPKCQAFASLSWGAPLLQAPSPEIHLLKDVLLS
ncbi:MAG: hypothetical protein LBF76_00190 [Holosporales bacterium]|nr:hypothetical protein [Holosporales bacterium]